MEYDTSGPRHEARPRRRGVCATRLEGGYNRQMEEIAAKPVNPPNYGAIEAGGTKFRVAVSRGRELIGDITIPTTTPEETLRATVDYLMNCGVALAGVGIASFGPLDLDPASAGYGSIVATPKPGWSGADIRGAVASSLEVPVSIDVDVNGAALAEWLWGAAQGLETFIYITVGTGIGGGLFANGRPHHGLGHPEMGHLVVAAEAGDEYAGRCPFHGGCFEGMAAGPAISDRWQAPVHQLHERNDVWELEARYLAQGLRTLSYVAAPQRIILGGGVLRHDGLLELVRSHLESEINGYAASPLMTGSLDDFVVAPTLGQDAGLYGAVALAELAHEARG